jgi:DNA invertase Pin-like site-specific DNA recombinase
MTPNQSAGRAAREYARVSKGRGRTARSITDQHTENLIAEQQHGPWAWGTPYADTGSASKYARHVRDDFEKMLADLKSGAFGQPGDVLVLWEISRLARETGRGVELVDAAEAGSFLIHVTSHGEDYGRTYDPRNYSDRHALISGINDAEKEARLLSARTLRGVNSAAREGRPHGTLPFGYARDYELIDSRPRVVRQYPDPAEGPLVRELFERVAEGVPIFTVAQDWRARGITSRDGVLFSPQSLRSMLIRPAYAGLRKNNGQLVAAEWEGWTPVVSRTLYDQVQALLADPSRRTYNGARVKHALTSTLRCDVCAGPIVVRYRNGSGVAGYECEPGGCVRVNKAEVDRIIIGDPDTGSLGVMLAWLAAPHRHAALSHPDTSDEGQAIRSELASIRIELEELEATEPANLAEARMVGKLITAKEEQKATLEAHLLKLSAPDPLADLLPTDPGADVLAWWMAADVNRQRAIASILLSPAMLGQVRLTPSPVRTSPAPAADRLAWYTTT